MSLHLRGCGEILVPGGGVEPPRPEGRRILSPLRLPVPPSRLRMEVLDFTYYFTLCSFVIQNNECETVQESVKVLADFHKSLSLAHELHCVSSSGQDAPRPSPTRAPVLDFITPRTHRPIP